MREYLNSEERNILLLIMNSTTYAQDALANFTNLTKDERKWLKTSNTLARKAMKSIVDRMPIKEKTKIVKHSKDFEVRILTKVGANTLEKRLIKEHENVNIKRYEIEMLATQVIHSKCENCNTSCNLCDVFDILDKFKIPKYEVVNNCPYAYKNIKPKSRKNKKHKNRFDEDVTEFEYNFKPKGR